MTNDTTFNPGQPGSNGGSRSTIADFTGGLRLWPLWQHFAWEGIRERYRRSAIGMLWITMTAIIFVAAVGTLFGEVLGLRRGVYVPWLATGYVTWGLITNLITQGCRVFSQKSSFILSSTLPLSTYVFETIWRCLIAFAFGTIAILLVLVYYRINVTLSLPISILGIALIAINGIWVGLIMGIICLRFPDVLEIIQSFLRIAFFLTPIIWQPDMLSERAYFADFNPFTHFIALVRDPLLGEMPDLTNFVVCFVMTIALGMFALSFFGRYRRYIPIWV